MKEYFRRRELGFNEKNPWSIEKEEEEKRKKFFKACEEGKIDIVQIMLDENIDYNQHDEAGDTPLFWACQENHSNVVQLLLQQPNINTNTPLTYETSKGATPLIIASYLGNYECVKQLLQHSTIDTTLTFQKKTALQWSRPNARADGWEFLEDKINVDGRQNCQNETKDYKPGEKKNK